MWRTPDSSRPQGLLTKKDRAYLLGDEVPDSKQGRYQRRSGLEKRISNGLLDFQYLWDMDADERRRVTDGLVEDEELYRSLGDMFAFIRYCCLDRDYDLEELLASGIRQSYQKEGGTAIHPEKGPRQTRMLKKVTVNINTEFTELDDIDALLESLREGEKLSHRRLAAILLGADLTEEDWQRIREVYESYDEE